MKYVVGLTFPKLNPKYTTLEPSVIHVLPKGKNVKYLMNHEDIDDNDIEYYLCSVYISGVNEFKKWAIKKPKNKIIIGGYEPTLNPRSFIGFGYKIVTGLCDDLYETIKQNGDIVKGVVNYKNLPRYDLYDISNNKQIIPDAFEGDVFTSINTSMGCHYKCDFCCSHLMSSKITSKPLDYVKKEVDIISKFNGDYIFIRDENFLLQSDWKEKLSLISSLNSKIYLFASAATLNEENIRYMKKCNVYMICIGLEDINRSYNKNKNLDKVCKLLKKYKIFIYLSFIVDPLYVMDINRSNLYYDKLLNRLYELMPEMICANILMPFPGTKIWSKYKNLINEEDYKYYDSKSAFLIKNKMVRTRIEMDLIKYQLKYFKSDKYNKMRKFENNDILHKTFIELENTYQKYLQKKNKIIEFQKKEMTKYVNVS